jgi:hypothetical protein
VNPAKSAKALEKRQTKLQREYRKFDKWMDKIRPRKDELRRLVA